MSETQERILGDVRLEAGRSETYFTVTFADRMFLSGHGYMWVLSDVKGRARVALTQAEWDQFRQQLRRGR